MKKHISFLLVFISSLFSSTLLYSAGGILPTDLKTEWMVNPLGIDVPQPGLSWLLISSERGQKQVGYQVIVASSETNLSADIGDVWNSDYVKSSEQSNIIYNGPALLSGTRYYWKIKVWDKNNNPSGWSKPAWWEMGLLRNSDWVGTWIGTTSEMASPFFRKDFTISKTIKKATAYVYGLGWYELHLNGYKVGDQVLTPANMDYSKRTLYESYDITSYLKSGGNAVGIWLANGYGASYSEYGWKWTDSKRAILQMNIEFTDGSMMNVVTDGTWKTAASQIISAEMYNGETYDATQEKTGWDTNGYNDESWDNVAIKTAPQGEMHSNMSAPVRVVKTIKPVSVTQPIPGRFVFDMGQNFAGWVRIHIKAATRGTKIIMRHAETINKNGTINTITNRSAEATDTYTCKGSTEEEIYEPRFTYHGFRYVEVTGYPGTPPPDNIEGCVIHADVESTGSFSCSNNLINKIHSNFQWTMLNNMVSIVTDNPVRNERTPCQMDWNCLYEAAIQDFDVQQYFKNWFSDIFKVTDIPVWSAGQVMGPWLLYQYYGDKRILESFYSSSKGEVDYCIANAETSKFWISSFGDWCSTFGDGTYDKSYSEGELVSTTLYFYITNLLSQIAGILGKTGDSTNYAIKANSILTDFNHRHFNDTTNTYGNGKQITYIMPLLYGMVPSDKESAVFRNLLNNVVERSMGHFGTGIYGTSFLLDILCDYGRPDVVYTLLNKTTYPSFGDQIVNHSATTTWEQWGVISTGKEMETYDHAMFSGADKTFYTKFAGIRPLTPGYKTISIKPVIPDSLTYVNSSVKTVRGVIYSNWDKFDGVYIHNISIPVNTTAIVYIPGNNSRNVYENGIPASEAVGIHYMRTENNYIVYKVESGSYYFSYGKPIKQVESLLNHQSYNEQYWWHRVGMAFIKD